jgi:hypothetical protein
MFIKIPNKIISKILILPVEKTIKFGGVLIGNKNANEQAKVVGINNNKGLIDKIFDIELNIGINICMIAKLSTKPVNVTIMILMINKIKKIFKFFKNINHSDIKTINPEEIYAST